MVRGGNGNHRMVVAAVYLGVPAVLGALLGWALDWSRAVGVLAVIALAWAIGAHVYVSSDDDAHEYVPALLLFTVGLQLAIAVGAATAAAFVRRAAG